MRIVTRLIAINRGRILIRQLRVVERSIQELPARGRIRLNVLVQREMRQASQCDFPHLYGTAPEERYLPWGQGTDIGYARALSDNPEVRLRGLALWLTVAFHETRDSPHANLQPPHRQLLRLLRGLQEAPAPSGEGAIEQWMDSNAA